MDQFLIMFGLIAIFAFYMFFSIKPKNNTDSAQIDKSKVYTTWNFFNWIRLDNERYLFHHPAKPEKDKKYPILIFLHGYNKHEDAEKNPENFGWVRCLIQKVNAQPASFESFVYIPITPGWGPEPKRIKYIINKILEDNENADPSRIYIVGLSMGGFAACEFLKAYPAIPAALVLICGASSLSPEKAHELKNKPIRLYHGDNDKTVPIDVSRNFYQALRDAGNTKAEFINLTGYGHLIWNFNQNSDMLEWLFKQS
ncbi:MAG: dienelactone hydrolase family protein [Treponema sp.]|nr:dienelactone hydrolase family protein [Treponema sp.]